MKKMYSEEQLKEIIGIEDGANAGEKVINKGMTVNENGDVSIGRDADIDGDIKVNGIENLTDKDGNPLKIKEDKDFELIKKIIMGYSVLKTQPADWTTNYSSYYKNTGTVIKPVYTALTSAETFVANTYYSYTDDIGVNLTYNFDSNKKDFIIKFYTKASSNTGAYYNIWLKDGNTNIFYQAMPASVSSEAFREAITEIRIMSKMYLYNYNNNNNATNRHIIERNPNEVPNNFLFTVSQGQIKGGSYIEIYGR